MKLLLVGACFLMVGGILADPYCQLTLGKSETGETLLHTIQISRGPVLQPIIMSLLFDYLVSPVDVNLKITRVFINADLVGADNPSCQASWPTNPTLPKGFQVTLTSLPPVLQMSGTAEVYGIRQINVA